MALSFSTSLSLSLDIVLHAATGNLARDVLCKACASSRKPREPGKAFVHQDVGERKGQNKTRSRFYSTDDIFVVFPHTAVSFSREPPAFPCGLLFSVSLP